MCVFLQKCGRNVLPLWISMYIYFFKITIAYILPDLPLQPAMVLVYLFQKVYILAKLSHIFNFLSMKLSCDLNILYIAYTIDLNILYCILYLFMFWFNGAHNVGYLCISIFFCNLNHIKTAVESTMLCVCFCKNVVEMCCRYEFLCIYFFKIAIAYILQDLPLQPAMVLVYLFQKAYILAKLSHIFNFLRMELSCDLNILYILHIPLI